MKKNWIILFVACSLFSCDSENKKNKISEVKEPKYTISQYLNNCKNEEVFDSNSKTVVDSMEMYSMRFTSDWDVENVMAKDLIGVYAFDTASFLRTELIRTITVSQSTIKKGISLDNYFSSELKGMEDEGFSIKEVGTIEIDNFDARWVLNTSATKEKTSYSIFIYTINYSLNSAFIIELNVENTDSPKVELCKLKSIIDSLTFLSPDTAV